MSDARGPDAASKSRLRLWIRMLRLTRAIEAELRTRLRHHFGATLPRFDAMAALYRFPDGMILSDLSRFLMVSNGNVTGIINRLDDDALIERTTREGDRRTSVVRLSAAGTALFEAMARAHEGWIDELLGAVPADTAQQLAEHFKQTKHQIREIR